MTEVVRGLSTGFCLVSICVEVLNGVRGSMGR